ncbi:unnamed protein product, partial [Ectocarpus sp. 12 AP-2014]
MKRPTCYAAGRGTKPNLMIESTDSPSLRRKGKTAVGLALCFDVRGVYLGVPFPERRSTCGGWISV